MIALAGCNREFTRYPVTDGDMSSYYTVAAINSLIGMGIVTAVRYYCTPGKVKALAGCFVKFTRYSGINGDICCYYTIAAINSLIGMCIITSAENCNTPGKAESFAGTCDKLA